MSLTDTSPEASDPLLSLADVAVRFGGVAALDGVSFDVPRAEVFGVIGPNGAGKTTLLNVISGFVKSSRGSVRLDGIDVLKRGPAERARHGLGRTFQTPRLFPRMTVADSLTVAQRQRPRDGVANGLDTIDEVLELVGIGDNARDVTAERLTSGERRFAELARALMLRPSLLLLDEPATGLREVEIHALSGMLNELRERYGIASLLISHNMQIVNDCCRNVVVLDSGRVLSSGTPAVVRHDPAVVRAYFGSEEVTA